MLIMILQNIYTQHCQAPSNFKVGKKNVWSKHREISTVDELTAKERKLLIEICNYRSCKLSGDMLHTLTVTITIIHLRERLSLLSSSTSFDI